MSAFSVGVGLRLLVAAAIAAAVVVAVLAIEAAPAAGVAATAPAPHPPSGTVAIACDSTFPVARWRISLDGRALDGSASERGWRAEHPLPAGARLLIEAERVDPLDDAAGALRIAMSRSPAPGRTTLVWANGSVSTLATVP